MVIGTILICLWIWFLSAYQSLPINVIKELMLWFGIGVVFMIIELVWEIKFGFKIVGLFLLKVVIFPIKKMHEKRMSKKTFSKIKNGEALTKKEHKFFNKWKEKNQ